MPDLIAEYGDYELLVVAMVEGNPKVFHDGQVRWATDVTIRGQRLSGLIRAPYCIPAPAGLWADFDWTPEGGNTERQSFPVLALRVEGGSKWARGLVLGTDGIEVCDEYPSSSFRFLGYRTGDPAPFCPHDAA